MDPIDILRGVSIALVLLTLLAYAVFLRAVRRLGRPVDHKGFSWGIKANFTAYLQECRERGTPPGLSFWAVVIGVVLNVIVGLLIVALKSS